MNEIPSRAPIDPSDRAIIAALAKDVQTPNSALSKSLGLSETAVANRIDKLISARQMKVTVQRDIRTLGYRMMGLVQVTVAESRVDVREIGREIGEIAEVLSVNILPDRPQLLLIVVAADMPSFVRTVEDHVASVAGVEKCSADICLEILKFEPGLAAL